tara:strand:- start:396 stop:554 length:159 start_codon:yes stop_codon:yes gene_type:complete
MVKEKPNLEDSLRNLYSHITKEPEANMELEYLAHQADEDREIDRDMHNEDYE